jgi:hypothetical protein
MPANGAAGLHVTICSVFRNQDTYLKEMKMTHKQLAFAKSHTWTFRTAAYILMPKMYFCIFGVTVSITIALLCLMFQHCIQNSAVRFTACDDRQESLVVLNQGPMTFGPPLLNH